MTTNINNTPLSKSLEVLYFSELGTRKLQEDAYFISDDQKLFVVCDGVGGTANGAYASFTLVNLIGLLYKDAYTADNEGFIKDLIANANELLVSKTDIEHQGGSTTIALLYLDDSSAYIAHIGDSKIYYISAQSKEWWVSKDHSFVQELFEAGIISTEQEMKSHPLKSRITKAISNDEVIDKSDIVVQKIEGLKKNDVFIVCSDGVVEKLKSSDIVDLFTAPDQSFGIAFQTLKETCLQYSKDNNTAIGLLL